MTPNANDRKAALAFEALADTLADAVGEEFDVVDFMQQITRCCAEVLEVAAAGVLLTDARGALRVVAASTEESRLLEVLQMQTEEGPCPESFRTGSVIVVPDLRLEGQTWPAFAREATNLGFTSVHAVPMRLHRYAVGTLNLFGRYAGALDDASIRMAQALADVATIGLLQARAHRRPETVSDLVQMALSHRVVIEMAQGMVAERSNLSLDEAFAQMRHAARAQQRRLSDLAMGVVEGTETVQLD